jgi:hypothetical protein
MTVPDGDDHPPSGGLHATAPDRDISGSRLLFGLWSDSKRRIEKGSHPSQSGAVGLMLVR